MEFFWILLLVLLSVSIRIGEAQSKHFFINCGSNSSVNVDGRKWVGGLVPGNNFTLTSPGIIASTDSSDRESIENEIYMLRYQLLRA